MFVPKASEKLGKGPTSQIAPPAPFAARSPVAASSLQNCAKTELLIPYQLPPGTHSLSYTQILLMLQSSGEKKPLMR